MIELVKDFLFKLWYGYNRRVHITADDGTIITMFGTKYVPHTDIIYRFDLSETAFKAHNPNNDSEFIKRYVVRSSA